MLREKLDLVKTIRELQASPRGLVYLELSWERHEITPNPPFLVGEENNPREVFLPKIKAEFAQGGCL